MLQVVAFIQIDLSDKSWERSIDPVEDGVVMPEVGAPHISLGREQRGEHCGLSSPDDTMSHYTDLMEL